MSLDIDLLRETFEAVKPIAPKVVNYFYESLLNNFPELKPLFKNTKMAGQKKALINSLVFIVENVDNANKLVPYLKKMGGRHRKYGAEPEHYNWVGQTLLDTLSHFFADDWTAEAESTWISAIEFVAKTMIEGADEIGQKNRTTNKKSEIGPIESAARNFARDLLMQYLDEIDGEIVNIAKERARKILLKSVEDEAKRVIKVQNKRAAC